MTKRRLLWKRRLAFTSPSYQWFAQSTSSVASAL